MQYSNHFPNVDNPPFSSCVGVWVGGQIFHIYHLYIIYDICNIQEDAQYDSTTFDTNVTLKNDGQIWFRIKTDQKLRITEVRIALV